MKKRILKKVKALQLGDLVEVFWNDASKGEARIHKKRKMKTQFEIPVRSTGYFIGVAGEKTKHVIIVRDTFQLNRDMGVYDVDFNCIPIGMIYQINVAVREALPHNFTFILQKALLRTQIIKRKGRITVHV